MGHLDLSVYNSFEFWHCADEKKSRKNEKK